jgi:hypothetical protein
MTTVRYKSIGGTWGLFPRNADMERHPQLSQVVATKDNLMQYCILLLDMLLSRGCVAKCN